MSTIAYGKNEKRDIALHSGYFDDSSNFSPEYNDIFLVLVGECILANIGRKFGIGGLFNVARQEVQDNIYDKWEELSPALKSSLESF